MSDFQAPASLRPMRRRDEEAQDSEVSHRTDASTRASYRRGMLVVPLRRRLDPPPGAAAHRNTRSADVGHWSTSSFGAAADTSPRELSDLSDHLDRCRRLRGRFFRALCLSDSVSRFLAPRFMTTLVAISLLGAMFMAH
jgi:hypothetical protein